MIAKILKKLGLGHAAYRLACLEKALRSGDYGSYLAYCRLH